MLVMLITRRVARGTYPSVLHNVYFEQTCSACGNMKSRAIPISRLTSGNRNLYQGAGDQRRKHLGRENTAWLGGTRFGSSVRNASRRAAKIAHRGGPEVAAIPSFVEIRELASLLRVKPKVLFKSLGGYLERKKHRIVLSGVPHAFPKLGNVIVPYQDVQAVAKLLGKRVRFLDVEKQPRRTPLEVPSESDMSSWDGEGVGGHQRRPVIVLLGHFNHGKTTILDALLGPGSGIAEREAGGITQEIRARTVSLEVPETDEKGERYPGESSRSLGLPTVATLLDTPGQEIFYRMRRNGARVADAVLLVVSAVDGVRLQTSESIGCAEELGLPAVVALNKIDLLQQEEAAQRLKDLSDEIREFVAIEDAQVLPLSAHTGFGMNGLRGSLAAALGTRASHCTATPTAETTTSSVQNHLERESSETVVGPALRKSPDEDETGVKSTEYEGVDGDMDVCMAEGPPGAATATVLDYVSSAKTGKLMLLLVDSGVLRPGDFFVSGLLWGSIRSIYDEQGVTLLDHAGPGVAAKVVVIARTKVSDAPLGEPFRVLTGEAAEKVALVRALSRTMDGFIDYGRLASDFPHLLEVDAAAEVDEISGTDITDGMTQHEARVEHDTCHDIEDHPPAGKSAFERPKGLLDDDDDLAPEEMPVTVVVKADSANTLASILDALGDWGDVDNSETSSNGQSQLTREDRVGGEQKERAPLGRHAQEWGEGDLQHKQRQRLVVSVARSGVGAVTSSDVRLARDCECPVFAHNVKADASATRELKRVGGGVIAAIPEGEDLSEVAWGGIGGKEGFIGRAGEGRECVVTSETVGELLGEIERFVLRVR